MTDQPPKRRKTAPSKPTCDPVADVISKYTACGWATIVPRGSMNDLIAQKDKKLHFVQVVTADTQDNPRFQGIAKNTFIQNAFSNAAQPVYATVAYAARPSADNKAILKSITLEDVNQNSRIII